jgi:uncharacterized RDD family membrane protein YckC
LGQDDPKEITVDTLRTPPLQIPPAPISKRLIAGLIDSLIIGLVWLAILEALHRGIDAEFTNFAYLAAVTFAYYFLQESLFSLTIGKRLLGLRILGKGGDPISIQESLLRNILRFVDWLPFLYILGALSVAISGKRQRLGDLVAGTFVTLTPEKDINPPPAPFLFH